MDKIVILIGERLNECIEGWNLPIRDCELPGMKGGHKNKVIYAKFGKDGEDELIIFLLNFTLLQLEHQLFNLVKKSFMVSKFLKFRDIISLSSC